VGVEISAKKEGTIWEGEGKEVPQIWPLVDDVVIIVKNKNRGVEVEP
jgi:hypothetical protein